MMFLTVLSSPKLLQQSRGNHHSATAKALNERRYGFPAGAIANLGQRIDTSDL